MAGPVSQSVEATLGVLFVGVMLSIVLYGLTFCQTYIYFQRFTRDPISLKTFVLVLWLLDTSMTALLAQTQFFYHIQHFTVPVQELQVTKPFSAEGGLTTATIFLVQLFYAFRVWTVTNKKAFLPTLIVATSSASCALGVVLNILLSERTLVFDLVENDIQLVLTANAGLLTICNLTIIVSLFYYLCPSRRPTMRIPKAWFPRIILVLASRGMCFTLLGLALLVSVAAIPHSHIWVILYFIISKAYVNDVLAVLNMRKAEAGRGVNEEDNLITPVDRQLPSAMCIQRRRPPLSSPATSRPQTLLTFDLRSSISVRTRSNSNLPANEVVEEPESRKSSMDQSDAHSVMSRKQNDHSASQ